MKKVVKSAKKPAPTPARDVAEGSRIDKEASEQTRTAGDGSKMQPPKIHAKVVTVIFSVGTDDRDRSFEDFVEDLRKKVKPVPIGGQKKGDSRAPGVHMTTTGGYYILDGKVCLPEDYDPKTKNFKKGAVSPAWAGGPTHKPSGEGSQQKQMQEDAKNLSSDEYNKKYKIGAYRQLGSPGARLITDAEKIEASRARRADKERAAAALKKGKKGAEVEEDLPEFDWVAEDVLDDEKMSKVADEATAKAIKRIVKKPSKKTVKVVKRGKK